MTPCQDLLQRQDVQCAPMTLCCPMLISDSIATMIRQLYHRGILKPCVIVLFSISTSGSIPERLTNSRVGCRSGHTCSFVHFSTSTLTILLSWKTLVSKSPVHIIGCWSLAQGATFHRPGSQRLHRHCLARALGAPPNLICESFCSPAGKCSGQPSFSHRSAVRQVSLYQPLGQTLSD